MRKREGEKEGARQRGSVRGRERQREGEKEGGRQRGTETKREGGRGRGRGRERERERRDCGEGGIKIKITGGKDSRGEV